MPKSRSTRIAARATSAAVVTALGLSLAACSGGFGTTAEPSTSESGGFFADAVPVSDRALT